MYYVYVLQSEDKKLYKGITNNLDRRLKEYKLGGTKSTSHLRGLNIIYKEIYNDFEEARKRELYLKSAAGRRFLKKVINS